MPPRTKAERAADVTKGLTALVALVVIVIGIPIGLARFAAQWLPTAAPTLDQARNALGRPLSDEALLTGLTLAAWALWALFTAAVAVELLSWARHAPSPSFRRTAGAPAGPSSPRIRIPGLQNAAAGLVLSALLILPAGAANASAGTQAAPAPVTQVVPDRAAVPAAPATAAAVPSTSAVDQPAERYTVRRGDSPWRIAERQLGAGERWRELRHDNGHSLTAHEIIYAGQVILVPAQTPAAAPVPPAGAAAAGEEQYVVRPGDSLWEIAEDELGDGEKHQTIWTANRGRVMDDGVRFRNPDLIRPGWKLTVPGHPAAAAVAAQPGPAETPPTRATPDAPSGPEAGPDTNGASATAPPPLVVEPAPPAVAAPTPHPMSPPVTAARTTWPPPPPARSPAQPADTSPTPTSVAAAPSEPAAAPQEPQEAPSEQTAPERTAAASKDASGRVALPWGIASAGLAAAAVVGLVSRRRRRQIGLRRPGRRPPLPTGDAAVAETALRVGADPNGATLVDEALAAVAVAVDVDGAGLPEILGAHLVGNRVELLLASPFDDVPEPFKVSADGLRWSAVSADVVGFVAPVDHPCSPAPTMVTLGQTETGMLLVNLERIGLLALEGDSDRAAGVLRRMAFELGARYLNAVVHVVLVGLPGVSGLEDHVETADSLGEALDRALSLRGWNDQQLAAYEVGSADVARAAGLNGDTWAPSVVLAAGPFTDEELRRAAEVTADPGRSGIAVAVASDRTATRWALDLDDALVDVGPLGLAVDLHGAGETSTPTRVVGYSTEEAEAVSSVLETAARTDDVSPTEPPYDGVEEWAWSSLGTDSVDAEPGIDGAQEEDEQVGLHVVPEPEDPEPNFDVCIRVLGPIEVTGNHDGAAMKPRPKSLDMAVLLALHRPGYTAAQIKGFLWPKRAPAKSTFHSTASAARALLRRVPDEDLIPNTAVAGGMTRYRVKQCVGTDWDRFQWLKRNARGAATADRLTEALALVRGEPLTGAEDWAFTPPYITEMRCAIVDAAHKLAQLRLEANDLPRATEAARQGLRASPWEQLPYGDLMMVSHKAGNPSGVQDVWNELRARLEEEDGDVTIEPGVQAIYDRCGKRHAR